MIDGISKKGRTAVDDFVAMLKARYGQGLISVALYGSAASGEYLECCSNVNIAIVLNDTSLANLSKISADVVRNKYARISPLFFTENDITNSTDVFPIEFLDMKENYKILFGKDFLKDLQVDLKNLRFQCEQELKSKMINIRRAFLQDTVGNDTISIINRYFTSVTHILRNIIRLKGMVPPYSRQDVVKEGSRLLGLDLGSFKKILEVKESGFKVKKNDAQRLLFDFTEDLGKIIEKVDKI